MAGPKTSPETSKATERPSIAEAHPRLYHYTGEHALKSIVANNTLWSTYFEDLNDAAEFRHMRAPLADELGDRFVPVVEAFNQQGGWRSETVRSQGGVSKAAAGLGKMLMGNLYKATFGTAFRDSLYPCFVTSFCAHKPDGYVEDHGLLSQWRGYGAGADGGYCLVFDTRRFEALIEEERQEYQFLYVGLGVAHYFKDRATMPPDFAELAEQGKEAVRLMLEGANPSLDDLFEPFVRGATTTKHRGFEEECEVRLVTMPLSQLGDERMRNVPGYESRSLKSSFTCDRNAKKKRHIRLFSECSALPLVRVIIGPARDQARNAAIAREAVGDDVEVVCSRTPFIA